MKTSTVRTVISDFLSSSKPEVLAIKGSWGVGKTHLWKCCLKENRNTAIKKYCYISLFGISSIQELKTAIAFYLNDHPSTEQEIKPFCEQIEPIKNRLTKEFFFERWENLKEILFSPYINSVRLFRILKPSSNKLLKSIPHGNKVSIVIDAIAPALIKNMIICFDDFERLSNDSNKISAEEVLGFISELKEEKNCKIVLIFNEEKLGEKREAYTNYREKVVDKEVIYAPPPEESLEIAFSNHPQKEAVAHCCQLLGIKNIRLFFKIKTFLDMLLNECPDIKPKVLQDIIQSLTLIVACFYRANEQMPKMETFKNYNNMLHYGRVKDTPEEKIIEYNKLSDCFRLFQKSSVTPLDSIMEYIVQHGFIEGSEFTEEIQLLNASTERREKEQKYSQLLQTHYAYSFNNSVKDFTDPLVIVFKESIDVLHLGNLFDATSILNELKKQKLSNELVDYYFDNKEKSTLLNSIQGLLPLQKPNSKTSYLNKKIYQFYKENQPQLSLKDVLLYIHEHRSWDTRGTDVDKETFLNNTTENDFYNLFMDENGETLHNLIRASLLFSRSPDNDQLSVKEKATNALLKIAKINRLNAAVIKNLHHISLDNQLA